MSKLLVYAEIAHGAVHDISLQSLTKARQLANGQPVTVVTIGSGINKAAQSLFACGANEVLMADHEALKDYLSAPYLAAMNLAWATGPFDAVILPATTTGNDLAPLLAAQLDAACVLDAVQVENKNGKLIATRVEFDRKVFADYCAADSKPLVLTVKDGMATPATPTGETGAPHALAYSPPATQSKIVRRDVATKSVNLNAAKVIVGAGAGLASKENFEKVRDLANALGAQIGATRAVIDAGWLPADHQIGQTGATVRPDLYIACGVSGAVQHWVGISEARTIIAINTDKSAPIFRHAHYRVVGDVNAVLPKLIKASKS